ncbi:PD-(D/E)XK motif protein [Chloroflexota bacterium]
MSIHELYQQLVNDHQRNTYSAIRISENQNAYLAVDREGAPCLFIPTGEKVFDAPLRTSNVVLQLGQEYELALTNNQQARQLFHSLCCESTQTSDIDTFLTLVNAFLSGMKDDVIDGDSLSSFFKSLIKLFSVVPARDVIGERQGLWGELFMMRIVRGYIFWASYWHNETREKFDFTCPEKRVEVKTTLNQERLHHFSHGQVFSSHGEDIAIASLMLREDTGGLSLRDLILDCKDALIDTPFFIKLEKATRSAKMYDTSESGPVFNPQEAMRSLAWFRASDVPHFRIPEPSGVSDTRYKVDLSMAPPIAQVDLDNWIDSWPEMTFDFAQV